MTTLYEGAPASPFAEFDIEPHPVAAGIATVERLREEQQGLLNAANASALGRLGHWTDAFNGEAVQHVQEAARREAGMHLDELVTRHIEADMAALPAEQQETPEVHWQVMLLFCSADVRAVGDTEWHVGSQNPDGTWNVSGQERLHDGLREIFATPAVEAGEQPAEEAGDHHDTTVVDAELAV